MKRLIFTILTPLIFVFLCAPQALQATAYYFDLASGNDTTGDGTYGTPWKTIDKCTNSRSAGDECRGALTAITTLAGTLTFTNGSTSVATSADLTAVVAAGDVVGKNVATEGWWKVASVSSAAITLSYQYWGKTGSGSAVTGYKITPVNASEEYDVASSGTAGSRIKISGGWDLGTQTRTGLTAFNVYSSTSNGIDTNSKNSLEISHFIFAGASYGGIYLLGTTDTYLHDCFFTDTGGPYSHIRLNNVYDSIIENCILTGGVGTGIGQASGVISNLTILSTIFYSIGTGSGDNAIALYEGNGFRARNVECYNTYSSALNAITALGSFSFLEYYDCIFSTVRSAVSLVILSSTSYTTPGPYNFYNCTFTGTGGTNAVSVTVNGVSAYFKNCTFTAGSGVGLSVTSSFETSFHTIVNCESGADCVLYSAIGTIVHDSSADARSGKAIKYLSNEATYKYQIYKVGTVKIPSAATDLTLNAYIKDDAGFDGRVFFTVKKDGFYISRTEKTPTTSYVKESVVVPAASLTANQYLDLYVEVSGTAGSVWVDDFSAEQ
jgi:hypothetical protein